MTTLANSEAKQRAVASLKDLRVSPQKVRLVANLIRGHKVDKAIYMLQYSHKDVAKDVMKLVNSAVANAENNLGMDVDELYIDEIYVDKSLVRRKIQARARGRRNIIRKRGSRVVICLAEKSS
jgi:large subunit ribosomal protein L22